MNVLKKWLPAAITVLMAGAAQGALINLGDGTVKDTETNLIWLQDWNVNGQANWSTQKAWAEDLTFAGSDAWVLPEIDEYFALVINYGLLWELPSFTNVQLGDYWSGTDDLRGDPGFAWSISLSGNRILGPSNLAFYAVAVRPGNVTASVPEPQTLALALLALSATLLAHRRPSA